jgi:hypothetical protein
MTNPPQTIPEAIEYLKSVLPADTLDLIRGAERFDPAEAHFGLGAWIRNNLGLWKANAALLHACNTTSADDASSTILQALWKNLVETSTPEALARSRQIRSAHDAQRAKEKQAIMDAKAAKDAAITDQVCPHCGKPCPSYRTTCKYCRKPVRTKT